MMTDHADHPHVMNALDPAWRQAMAEAGPGCAVITPGGDVAVHDVTGLGEDQPTWQAFLDAAVGDCSTTHKWRDRGLSAYFDGNADPHRAAFNPVATMLVAALDRCTIGQAQPIFGTMVLTGFDFGAWRPAPLDSDQLAATADALIEAERYAQIVGAQLGHSTGE